MIIADDTPESEPVRSVDINKRRFHTLMLTGILLPILLYPLLSEFLPATLDFAARIFFSRVLIWAILGLMFLYARKGEMQNFFLWDEQDHNFWFYPASIIGCYMLAIAAGYISTIPAWLGYHEDNYLLTKMLSAMHKIPPLIYFGAITAGITEEFIFRGYILSRLSVLLKNKHVAVIISALIFGFIHLGYKSLREFIFAVLLGLIFGYHYQKYRNIKVLVATHFMVDVIAFLVYNPAHHK